MEIRTDTWIFKEARKFVVDNFRIKIPAAKTAINIFFIVALPPKTFANLGNSARKPFLSHAKSAKFPLPENFANFADFA